VASAQEETWRWGLVFAVEQQNELLAEILTPQLRDRSAAAQFRNARSTVCDGLVEQHMVQFGLPGIGSEWRKIVGFPK
jgi:hypothetical protein